MEWVFYLHKAYLNSRGDHAPLIITHDVKRCLADSKILNGHVGILSTQGTVAVSLIENDLKIQKAFIELIQKQFEGASEDKVARRSGTGASLYHLMAQKVGLSVTLPMGGGRLLSSPFHDVVAFDFEPKSGRREFVITVVGDGGEQK